MLLAQGWSIECVLSALAQKERLRLAEFIDLRYRSRFLEPIAEMHAASIRDVPARDLDGNWGQHIRPYGFAIMSLACLFIECFESYRLGIPTTTKEDFERINKSNPPKEVSCDKNKIPGSCGAFEKFFADYRSEFCGLDGETFYKDIRCGLLHQAQTKNAWVINIHHPARARCKADEVYTDKCLYRDSFVHQLEKCFKAYTKELCDKVKDDEFWKNPEQKIWWIAWLSDPNSVTLWLARNALRNLRCMKVN